MKSYRYVARDVKAARKEGVTRAARANDVLSWLRQQGLTPVAVNEVDTRAKEKTSACRRKRVKSSDLAALCSQLATMLEGGIPITAALDIVAEDIDNAQLQQVLQEVEQKIQKGQSLSQSIAQYPKIFNQIACAMISAGEIGGDLALALQRLAQYFENRDRLLGKVRTAITYPAFTFTFIMVMVVFIMTFIVPRFRAIFDELGGNLPAFTQTFMNFYDGLRQNIVYILGVFIAFIISAILASRTRQGHRFLSACILKIPIIGRVISQAFVAMFCRTMATLLAAGVSILDVLDILAPMARNDIIKTAIVRAKEHVVSGSDVSLSMAEAGFFPNMVVKMIQVGEKSGSLSKVLEKTAQYYESKVDAAITVVMSLLEPVMIVTVGAIVTVIVLALYLPIFSMSNVGG